MRSVLRVTLVATLATVVLVGWYSHIHRFGRPPSLAVGLSASVLLAICAFLLITLAASAAQLLPRTWPLLLRIPVLLGLAAVLCVALAWFQFAPAMLVQGWCKTTPFCSDHLKQVFNHLLSAGQGFLVLLSLPLIAVPTVFLAHVLRTKHRAPLR
jgi:hypothetical protein